MDNTAICLPADPDPDADAKEMGKERMIGDLISREALKRALEKRCRAPWEFIVGIDPSMQAIDAIQGETAVLIDAGRFVQCSNCEERIQVYCVKGWWINPNYCPNCGRALDRSKEEKAQLC